MIVNNASDLGAVLRQGRRNKHMSQADLGAIVGVSRQWVISAEQGAPAAQLGLMINALRAVDMLVDVVVDDLAEEADPVFGDTT